MQKQETTQLRGIRSRREVADKLGISKTRVAQIERKALAKLLRGLQADPEVQELYAAMV